MKRVEVKLGKTVNLGNYESLRVDVGLAQDVKDEEAMANVARALYAEVTGLLSHFIHKQLREEVIK